MATICVGENVAKKADEENDENVNKNVQHE
jgi:hypothetical protein